MRSYPQNIGFIDAALSAAGSIMGAGGPGGSGGGSQSVDTRTTINPNFQQSFNPQVSPNIQVNTGGGNQAAVSRQNAGGPSESLPPNALPLPSLPTTLPVTPGFSAEEQKIFSDINKAGSYDWAKLGLGALALFGVYKIASKGKL